MIEIDENQDLGDALLSEMNGVRNLTSSTPRKYDSLKAAFKRSSGAEVAVCYLSDMSKMWTPRVGQALLACPNGLVLLSSDSFSQRARDGSTYFDKLEKVVCWAPRIEVAIACTGWEGDWLVQCVVGPRDSLVCDLVTRAFPDAERRRPEVPPISRLPDPR